MTDAGDDETAQEYPYLHEVPDRAPFTLEELEGAAPGTIVETLYQGRPMWWARLPNESPFWYPIGDHGSATADALAGLEARPVSFPALHVDPASMVWVTVLECGCHIDRQPGDDPLADLGDLAEAHDCPRDRTRQAPVVFRDELGATSDGWATITWTSSGDFRNIDGDPITVGPGTMVEYGGDEAHRG